MRFTEADALCVHNTWLVTCFERTKRAGRERAWSKPAQSAFARRHLSNSAAIETGRTARRQEKRVSIVGGGCVGEDSGVADAPARLSKGRCKALSTLLQASLLVAIRGPR